jgi:hypothetical protein
MKKGSSIMSEKKQPRPRHTYTPEFKQQLVNLRRTSFYNLRYKIDDLIRERLARK